MKLHVHTFKINTMTCNQHVYLDTSFSLYLELLTIFDRKSEVERSLARDILGSMPPFKRRYLRALVSKHQAVESSSPDHRTMSTPPREKRPERSI